MKFSEEWRNTREMNIPVQNGAAKESKRTSKPDEHGSQSKKADRFFFERNGRVDRISRERVIHTLRPMQ